jgi:hypothetical protein
LDGVGDDCTNERLLVGVGGAAVAVRVLVEVAVLLGVAVLVRVAV